MNAISMVHKMQRLAMNVSETDTSSMLPAVSNRQKCATIVEEAEIDDDDHGQNSNFYGVEGRKNSV